MTDPAVQPDPAVATSRARDHLGDGPRPDPSGRELRIWPVPGIPEVAAGDDLGALIVTALTAGGRPLDDGDVLVVTSKIVSKALGLTVPTRAHPGPGLTSAGLGEPAERHTVIAGQTRRVVAERATTTGPTRIVESLSGVVAAAAGVDASNTGPTGRTLLLPADPDEAARDLHARIAELVPDVRFGVILSDTAGRPWRVGQTDFALGASGLSVLEDYRGREDSDGRQLVVTAIAIADELAAAADLVKGKTAGMPVALVRGSGARLVDRSAGALAPAASPGSTAPTTDRTPNVGSPEGFAARASEEPIGARALQRTGRSDWFALGSVEAARAALGVLPGTDLAERVGIASVHPEAAAERLARAVRVALADTAPEAVGATQVAVDGLIITVTGDAYAVGRLSARLEVALWSESFLNPGGWVNQPGEHAPLNLVSLQVRATVLDLVSEPLPPGG